MESEATEEEEEEDVNKRQPGTVPAELG